MSECACISVVLISVWCLYQCNYRCSLSTSQIVIFQPVKMITKMEPSQLAYDGDANSKAIIEFVKANL